VDAQTAFDEYVAWYSWAAATITDVVTCHAAATAALGALRFGADRDSAASAARAAIDDETFRQRIRDAYGSDHRYAEWFVWARSNLRLPDARCHEAAAAAVAAIGQTVEGLTTAPVLRDLSRRVGVEMPITEGVCAVLEGQVKLAEVVEGLMGRRPTGE
jgi:hypothetical protein